MDFTFEKWHIDYAGDVAEYANNNKIADNLRNVFPHPYTIDDVRTYISSCTENDESKHLIRTIVIEGKATGCMGITLKDDIYCKSAELGYFGWVNLFGVRGL